MPTYLLAGQLYNYAQLGLCRYRIVPFSAWLANGLCGNLLRLIVPYQCAYIVSKPLKALWRNNKIIESGFKGPRP